jgi:hypothetical protein
VVMRVAFYKTGEGRLCGWIAVPPHRRAFQGTTMAAGRDLPHDLAQFTIERALEIRDGFWGLLSHGATFSSVPGRRPTQPGRALVRAHHAALMSVEAVVNAHYLAWKRGKATPAASALHEMYARWVALEEGERLELDWPMRRLQKEAAGSRRHRAGRRGDGRKHSRGAA